jgi:uncharacterized OB-fold protein
MTDWPRPLPHPSGLAAEWYAFVARGELRFQRCTECDRWRHPPRILCPACGSQRSDWSVIDGRGRLFSWTVTHQPLHPQFIDVVPYVIAVVELDHGVRVVCSGRDLDREHLELDASVNVVPEPVSDEIGLLFAKRRSE